MMGLRVIDPGLWTTVQDGGVAGFREWGVPVGGAFDRASAGLANALLGNPPECAVLEMTLRGGDYRALQSLGIALAGAPIEASIVDPAGGRRVLRGPQSATLGPGDRLVAGRILAGARTYLAVVGGFQTPVRMGSRSREAPLTQGEELAARESAAPTRRLAAADFGAALTGTPLRILAGPEDPAWNLAGFWSGASFRVGSRSNRVGLRLEGPVPNIPPLPDRLSAPVAPGAIQLAGGQLIVLGVSGGTMGGYPHIAHVISADQDRLGQLRPGDSIRFQPVELAAARELDRQARRARRSAALRVRCLAGDTWGWPCMAR